LQTPAWVRGALAAAGLGGRPDGTGGPDGTGRPRKVKIALLATVVVAVLVVGGVAAGTMGTARAGQATRTTHHRAAAPARPLRVLSVDQGGAVHGTDGAAPIRVALSAPLAASSPRPVLHPAVPGSWHSAGTALTFTPATPFQPDTRIRVRFRAGPRGPRSAAGGVLAGARTYRLRTRDWSTLRLKQLLAQLGYLPLKWKPHDPTAPQPDSMATELAAVYQPPAGHFSWRKGYPSILATFWGGQSSLIMNGAIRAFQSNHGLEMTGVMTIPLWHDLLRAAARGEHNPSGYTYALASKASPETLTVWHDGHVVMHTLANTGIPAAPTADGTSPVYLRYRSQIMRGTNPDGSKYADPVAWVAYFSAGEAVHYFPRGSYGFPQSLGCVELPYTQAEQVWPYLTYGTLVTVR